MKFIYRSFHNLMRFGKSSSTYWVIQYLQLSSPCFLVITIPDAICQQKKKKKELEKYTEYLATQLKVHTSFRWAELIMWTNLGTGC